MASPDTQLSAGLLARARSGERAAREAVLAHFLPDLKAYLRFDIGDRLGGKESLDDLAQSVCADVLGELEHVQFHTEAAFRAWLRKVALNKAISKQRFWSAGKRDRQRERRLSGSQAEVAWLEAVARQTSPSEAAIGHEQADRLAAALRELSSDDRQVITLARVVGMPHAEIGELMGRSEEATRALLSRALVRLSAVLDAGVP